MQSISRQFQLFEKQCEEELKRKDMKIVLELDQKVMDQQGTLERAGVPGFSVTNNPTDVKLQMYLLEFIIRISQMKEFKGSWCRICVLENIENFYQVGTEWFTAMEVQK